MLVEVTQLYLNIIVAEGRMSWAISNVLSIQWYMVMANCAVASLLPQRLARFDMREDHDTCLASIYKVTVSSCIPDHVYSHVMWVSGFASRGAVVTQSNSPCMYAASLYISTSALREACKLLHSNPRRNVLDGKALMAQAAESSLGMFRNAGKLDAKLNTDSYIAEQARCIPAHCTIC